jgi:FdhE protein
MPRTAPGIRPEIRARLTRLEAADPEWRPLVAILRATHALTVEPGPRPVLDPAAVSESAEPVLHRRTLRIPPGWARHAIGTLAAAAAESDNRIAPALVADESRWPGLLAAALSDNRQAMAAFAAELGAPVDIVTTLAGYAATALLQRVAGGFPLTAHRSPLTAGCCPTCAAWPLLAEIRGIEQAYRLRCGRCGGDWAGEWLRCTFCGERDHSLLGTLILETGPGSATVQHCATCRQYLKVIPVLAPSEPFELLLRDLETVELDLSARERGFSGPPELGFALEVTVKEEVSP